MTEAEKVNDSSPPCILSHYLKHSANSRSSVKMKIVKLFEFYYHFWQKVNYFLIFSNHGKYCGDRYSLLLEIS